jgi:hypothetical protein
MRAPRNAGGAALRPTTYTYTAAMRAALGANLYDRALQVCRMGIHPRITYYAMLPIQSTGYLHILHLFPDTNSFLFLLPNTGVGRLPIRGCAP